MNKEQLEALKRVCDYLHDDEEADFEAYIDVEGMKENHIFNSVVVLQTFLDNHKN